LAAPTFPSPAAPAWAGFKSTGEGHVMSERDMKFLQCTHCGFKTQLIKDSIDSFSTNCVHHPDDILTPSEFVVLLYYSYVEIRDVRAALEWHHQVALHLNLKGRIRISQEGINVVLDGRRHYVDLYIAAVKYVVGLVCFSTHLTTTVPGQIVDGDKSSSKSVAITQKRAY
jgi:hypothetical protein